MISGKYLMIIAIIAVIVSAVNLGVIIIKAPVIMDRITGYASSGYVNITVSTQITINLTTDTINWGPGTVTPPYTNASLYTKGATTTANVTRGNWSTASTPGIVIANIGNVNASLTLASGDNAADFFGGTAADQAYEWNVSNKELASCTGGEPLGVWRNVNKTTAGKFCSQFSYLTASNEMYLDIHLVVPNTATKIGLQSDTITVTADTAGV